MQKKSIFALAVLLFLATALFGCGKKEADQGNASPASNSPAEKKQATVLLGLLKLTGGAPLYIAMEKGFF